MELAASAHDVVLLGHFGTVMELEFCRKKQDKAFDAGIRRFR